MNINKEILLTIVKNSGGRLDLDQEILEINEQQLHIISKKLTELFSLHVVSGGFNAGFLKLAVEELRTYRTPKKIIDYIESEKIKAILGNPPYDVRNCH